jgi:hypothetical protein
MDLHCCRLLPYGVNQLVDCNTIYVGTPHSLWFPLHLIEFARQELRYIRVESLYLRGGTQIFPELECPAQTELRYVRVESLYLRGEPKYFRN